MAIGKRVAHGSCFLESDKLRSKLCNVEYWTRWSRHRFLESKLIVDQFFNQLPIALIKMNQPIAKKIGMILSSEFCHDISAELAFVFDRPSTQNILYGKCIHLNYVFYLI